MAYRPMRTTRDIRNLQGRPAWYSVKNLDSGSALVTIYDEIGMFGVSAGDFMTELRQLAGKPIEMHINSPGGDVFDGVAIYNTLRQCNSEVTVIIDGLAASAASFIAQAASPGRLAMAPHSQMMIHNGFALAVGDARDLRKTADLLDQVTGEIAGIYADRSGKPAAHWLALMAEETWFTDKAAVAEGLADHVLGEEQPGNKWDLSVYLNAPQNADGNHAPMTGTHSHGHPAYGAQGSDGTHSHEHSHDGDASHAHDHAEPDGDEGDGQPPMVTGLAYTRFLNEKYSADDRKRMAGNGQAMPDGSYPIADEEDLDNAIHAVGRGGADHDAIRRHIIKRAKALGQSDKIPDNWNADGSLQTSAGNLADDDILAIFSRELDQLGAGKE